LFGLKLKRKKSNFRRAGTVADVIPGAIVKSAAVQPENLAYPEELTLSSHLIGGADQEAELTLSKIRIRVQCTQCM